MSNTIAVKHQSHTFVIQTLQIFVGSLAIALSAQLAFYLPWSPVPISAQTLVLALVAGFLGPKRGVLAVLAYLAEGIAGLPVFAGGAGGILAFCSPARLGYLLGFIPQVWIIGTFWQSQYRQVLWGALAVHLSASLALWSCGIAVLGWAIGYKEAISLGVVPFVTGDLAKIFVAIVILRFRTK